MFGVRTITIALGLLSLTVCLPVDRADAHQNSIVEPPGARVSWTTCALVRMVDEDTKGRRSRDEPCLKLAALGTSNRTPSRCSSGLASPRRHDYRPHR